MTGLAALAAWVLNSLIGLRMLLRWLTSHRTQPSASSFPPPLAFIHLVTATGGLALWITYLSTDRPTALAWAAFLLLNVNNGLGDTLLTRGWRARRGGEAKGSAARDYFRAAIDALSGSRPAVLAHGILAGATYFLVLLAALGVAN